MSDGLMESFRRIVRLAMARTDYHALYPAQVVSQNADGTLELKPDSQALAPVSKVPLRLGLPDCYVEVASGSRVLLGFEGGEPKRPVATLWDTSTLTHLELGRGASDAMVKGTAYRAAEDTLLTALSTFLGVAFKVAVQPPVGAPLLLDAATVGAAITLQTAITNFQATASSYLSTISKVK